MADDFRSIGELARASGLTVSALRFYDGAGVLVPAVVVPVTGYRWYSPEQLQPARLLAGLRRVGMPLAQISQVLGQRSDAEAVRRLLDAHLRRLEEGLADARRELSRIHALIAHEEAVVTLTTLTLPGAGLAAALDAVRFAVGTAPELPVLGGVLFEVDGRTLRLVATDRFRLAVAEAPTRLVDGPDLAVIVPADLVDQLRTLAAGQAEVTVTLGADRVDAEGGTRRISAAPLDHRFPDYRRLLREGRGDGSGQRVVVDVPALRATLTAAGTPTLSREHEGVRYDVAVLDVDPDGRLAVVDPTGAGSGPVRGVGVNREFLLDALDAAGRDQLVLELDGPIAPLAVRHPDDDRSFSILMPVRLS
ncbi:MAG TPA: MerR family transcriptional regulator [Micromonospora sp.]